jgi:hypothetical protein
LDLNRSKMSKMSKALFSTDWAFICRGRAHIWLPGRGWKLWSIDTLVQFIHWNSVESILCL